MAFTDNFTDVAATNLESHTPSGGGSWTRVDGEAGAGKIHSNALSSRMVTSNTLYTCTDQDSPNQYVQFKIGPNLQDVLSFVVCRATDSDNFIGVRYRDEGNGKKVQVYKRVGGTFTQIGTEGATTVVAGDTIRLECNGDDIVAKLNGVTQVTGTASDFNSVTKQGVVIRGDITEFEWWIDDFEAGALSAGASNVVPRRSVKIWSRR